MSLYPLEYRIEPDGAAWAVMFGGESHGGFDNRRSAIKSAVADAIRVEKLGYRVAVVASRPKGCEALCERIIKRPHL